MARPRHSVHPNYLLSKTRRISPETSKPIFAFLESDLRKRFAVRVVDHEVRKLIHIQIIS